MVSLTYLSGPLPWIQITLAVLACLVLSVPVEGLIRPAPGHRNRPISAWCIHFGSALLTFTLLLAIGQRPFFAAALSVALFVLLAAVSNAKWRALREPFVYSDFGLFSQALRYPRLYLPFFGIGRSIMGVVIFVAGLDFGVTLEPTLLQGMSFAEFVFAIAAGVAVSVLLVYCGIRGSSGLSLDPVADLQRVGILTSLWLYRVTERRQRDMVLASPYRRSADPIPFDQEAARFNHLPNLLVVQSESFFDARRLFPLIRPEILQRLDQVRMCSRSGRLTVPAWGANTMRTEFAFLSGIPADRLGVHRFNPYRRLARRPQPSIAWHLQSLGYHTVCIHPYPIGFFGRDRVYPNLGFSQFIDIQSFDARQTCGPYISDAAVTAKILEVMAAAEGPVFAFVITMENHGPLHLEKAAAEDEKALYGSRPPGGFDDLTVYLRHLRNADRMIGELLQGLAHAPRDSVLCFFGDHVPSMPSVYEKLDYWDGRTDYFIWHRNTLPAGETDLDVAMLGELLLDVAGIKPRSKSPMLWRPGRANEPSAYRGEAV